ncbi:MAG: dihydroxyacetone kinase subunit L [Tissierella sp.]|nr:dihydroxyacetone kinase subunit L [Tissierella sp.]
MANTDLFINIIENMAKAVIENKEYLTDLDRAIGDGDHGINMSKGFQAVLSKLDDMRDKDLGTILKNVAMTLISTVGGASGPLYGTAFLRAATAVDGKMDIDKTDILNIFEKAIEGVQTRGKAQVGEKTILDSLVPAYEALKKSYEKEEGNLEAFRAAEEAALKGVEYTKTIVAKKGRASYLGERSIGHQDPGATSTYIMIKSIKNILEENHK